LECSVPRSLVGWSLVGLRRRCLLEMDAERLHLDLPLARSGFEHGASASAGALYFDPLWRT
jgi:hypothetical protein